jgi:type IV pilus assembly protein PilC
MPLFIYEAKNIKGCILRGKMEALDEDAVIRTLRNKEYYPTKINLYNESMNVSLLNITRVTIKDLSIFCRQFSIMLSSGINISNALRVTIEQTENIKLERILGDVLKEVQKGKELSMAMSSFRSFPNFLVRMVRVGEVSGRIDFILETLAVYYDKEYRLNQKIKQSLTYPTIVCIFAFIVTSILINKVLPVFLGILSQYEGVTVPIGTRIIIEVNNVIKSKGLLLLGALLIIAFAGKYYKPHILIKFIDRIKIAVPLISKIYLKIAAARFARAFGILIKSGVPIVESMSVCSEITKNSVMKKALVNATEDLEKGMTLEEALSSSKIFPLILTQMIRVGEESGAIDKMLEKAADFYDGEVDASVSQITVLLEPVIILILSLIVGFVVSSIMLPIVQMYEHLS